jgi:putative SOS response-associated peptidase YedK
MPTASPQTSAQGPAGAVIHVFVLRFNWPMQTRRTALAQNPGMCNRYQPPPVEDFVAEFRVQAPANYPAGGVFPRGRGCFLRRAPDKTAFEREAAVGQWGLIPWFAKTATLPYSTNNARFEGVATTASFKQPWAKGQRCIIPAAVFWEPCWESGKNQWWRFKRADGRPWALAGLWAQWTDKDSGEILESYTMLTMNADSHPLMRRMHKPDPKLGPGEQDKRSVVALQAEDYDTWLAGTQQEAASLVQLVPQELFDAAPDVPA